MASLFHHFFSFAETYAVLLVWATVPLAFYASYLFMNNHFGIFDPRDSGQSERDTTHAPH